MKKRIPLILCMTFLLSACGAETTPQAGSGFSADTSSSQPASISQPAPPPPEASSEDIPPPDASDPAPPEAPSPLTAEDIEAARRAALDYYAGTVFEVQSLTEIEPREGELSFQAACSKGGTPVEPDRTISLERQDGVWVVLNEGY